MQKLFHFDSPQEVYVADACVISCFDARFDPVTRKLLKRRGILIYDHIKIPGSGKALGAPDNEGDRDFVLRMIRTSIRLHRISRVLLLAHAECGAYPGVPIATVCADLSRAANVILAAEPALTVECFFCDFDGIYLVS